MYNRWSNSLIVACLLVIFCLVPVMAQAQNNSTETKDAYSNEELKTFLIANRDLYLLQQQANAMLQSTETDQQKQEIMETTNQQMLLALQQAGLTADEYNSMENTIMSDTQLQERVQTIVSELSQEEEQK